MSDDLTRRDLLKTIGAAGVAWRSIASLDAASSSAVTRPTPEAAQPAAADGSIHQLSSTSDVFVPPRGRGFMKFSFDFPEPSVQVGPYQVGFRVFTYENAYALDPAAMTAKADEHGVDLTCTRFTWAGGQQTAGGTLHARIARSGDGIEWTARAEMDQPIKTVTAIVRGVPRGKISAGGATATDHRDNEVLFGYPFSAGDLDIADSLTTPLIIVEPTGGSPVALSSRDTRVRAKRFYLQPGEHGYRVELVHETEGWERHNAVDVPAWRVGAVASTDAATREHYSHVETAYKIPKFASRQDAPAWMKNMALAVTLHGMHYTGYVFNDYARMLDTLRWIKERIPADRVLAFISAWDGRYYWNYPLYEPDARMGGDAGFHTLMTEGRRLGFHMMPMFGTNAANTKLPMYSRIAEGATSKIDGDPMPINWVDWDNDRHMDGWLMYMNPGVDSWRQWLTSRIADIIERHRPDAYFLDIVGGWVNNTKADMHDGTRRMILELRQKYPDVAVVGEMHYDALLEFIPMFHAGPGIPRILDYAHFFQHLSHPAPGRGSSGV
ncbi:MAG TPA: hypothetical protein VG871_12715, partial [Vicinamibacterales bacterium]|nr:hypothetical protein [Vicinamibacterales bacterium]